MDIQGRLIEIFPNLEGDSARGHWVKGGFAIETNDTYPRQVAFMCFGEERIAMFSNIPMNTPVNVTFSPESRKFTGRDGVARWSTDLRCINVQPMVGGAQPVQAPMSAAPSAAPAAFANPMPAAPAANTMPDDNGDLPF